MIRYKGYTAVMEVDDEAGVIHGRLSGLRDVITFEGDSVTEAIQAFRDPVDDYDRRIVPADDLSRVVDRIRGTVHSSRSQRNLPALIVLVVGKN